MTRRIRLAVRCHLGIFRVRALQQPHNGGDGGRNGHQHRRHQLRRALLPAVSLAAAAPLLHSACVQQAPPLRAQGIFARRNLEPAMTTRATPRPSAMCKRNGPSRSSSRTSPSSRWV
eukprot:scaffold13314_cov63-Phaeocystis_antarctica.AAC.1